MYSPISNRCFYISTSPFIGDKFVTTFFDITERKNAENARLESERKFLNAFANAPIGMALVSLDEKFIEVNQALCKILGYSEEQLMALTVPEVTHPDDVSLEATYKKQTASGEIESFQFEKRYIHADGRIIWGILSVSTVTDQAGNLLYYIGQLEDISDRKQAQEALLLSEERYRRISSIISDISYSCSTEVGGGYAISWIKGAIERITGYTLDEMIALRCWGFLVDERDQEIFNTNITGLKPGESSSCEMRLRHKDGRTVWVASYAECLDGIDNNNQHLYGGLVDITGRKLAESKVKKQLDRMRALREIDIAISSSFDLHLTLGLIIQQVITHLNPDAADILLFDRDSLKLQYAAQHGFRLISQHGEQKLTESIAGRTIIERRTVFIPNLKDTDNKLAHTRLVEAEGFITYMAIPLITKGQVKGVLEIFKRQAWTPDKDWQEFAEILAGQAAVAIDSSQLFENLQGRNQELFLAYDATIEGWSRAMDLRDQETEGHTQRVTTMTVDLARKMGINDEEIYHIRHGALLHDIGKLGIPDNILNKAGALTDDEWGIMRKHPVYAQEMLAPIAYLNRALDIPYCHHEKWDGSGYPRHLKGDKIPLSARLFAIVDVWDALLTDRPYRKGWEREKVIEYIRAQSGLHFDPDVVDFFFEMIESS